MKILDTLAQFSNMIKRAFSDQYNRKLPTKLEVAQKNVREYSREFFRRTETYRSLTQGGGLQGSFGFPAGEEFKFADWFIDIIANNLVIKSDLMRASTGQFLGSVRLILPYETYNKLLNGVYSKVPIKGGQLYWVDWLLKRGDEVIIYDYHVVFTEGKGRAGFAIMGQGGSWKVPSQYSGTENDNFITRTIYESKEYLDGLSRILARDLL